MDPTTVFNWAALGCNCLMFLFLGVILILWMLSPRVEGSYRDRPQRSRVEHRRRDAPARPRRERQAAARPGPEPRETRQPTRTAPAFKPDASDISITLSEAQRAADAIGDIQIQMPVIPDFEMALQLPNLDGILSSEVPWAQAAEPAPVAVDDETQQPPAVGEAQVREAVQQVVDRIQHQVPAAELVTRRVKAAARQAPNPLAASTLAEGIDIILQDLIRREAEHLRGVIHIEPTPEGGVKIRVADDFYLSVAEVPEGRAKQLLQQAVRAWNQLWQAQNQPPGGKR